MQNKIVRLFDRRSRINFVSVVITLRTSADSTLRSLVFNLMVFSIAICEGLLLNFLFHGQISLIILGTRKIRLIPMLFIRRITCDLFDHSQLTLWSAELFALTYRYLVKMFVAICLNLFVYNSKFLCFLIVSNSIFLFSMMIDSSKVTIMG